MKSKAKGATKSAKAKSKTAAKKPAKSASRKTPVKAAKKAAAKTSPVKAKAAAPAKSSGKTKSSQAAVASKIDWAEFFSPLDDRVLVIRDETTERTAGGLYIPATATIADGLKQGRVVAVGRGHRDKKGRLRPLDVQIDDRVLFERYAGSEIRLREIDVVVLREKDVFGVAQ